MCILGFQMRQDKREVLCVNHYMRLSANYTLLVRPVLVNMTDPALVTLFMQHSLQQARMPCLSTPNPLHLTKIHFNPTIPILNGLSIHPKLPTLGPQALYIQPKLHISILNSFIPTPKPPMPSLNPYTQSKVLYIHSKLPILCLKHLYALYTQPKSLYNHLKPPTFGPNAP